MPQVDLSSMRVSYGCHWMRYWLSWLQPGAPWRKSCPRSLQKIRPPCCHRRERPAHPGERGLGVLAVGLRDMGRAAPHAVRADGRGDRLPDLPCAGFIGALQWRWEQCAGSGGADAEVIRRG